LHRNNRLPFSIQVRLQADNALSKSIRQMRVEVNLDKCRGNICDSDHGAAATFVTVIMVLRQHL
jgi:hypothetical protein